MKLATVTPDPFPHLILDGFWSGAQLDLVASEFPHPTDPRWRIYANDHEGKYEGQEPMWGTATRAFFDEVGALAGEIGEAFGIPDLTMETVGGGYHLIPPGGHLDVHTDFSRSPDTGLYRRLNFLVFLNKGWGDEGGRLELWDDRGNAGPAGLFDHGLSIAPEFNRTVVFATSSRSWHGHPRPAQRWRMSVAAYFFSPEPPEGFREQSTVWR